MRHLFALFLLLSCALTLLPGCERDEELVQTSGSLEMAQDTVLFDTVFTTIGTVTKRLWVYNRNSGAVKTDIRLVNQQGPTPFSLIIDGDAGNSASGVLIRGNDSLLVLVKALLGDNGLNQPFLIEDQLSFRTNGSDDRVRLLAYGQNAYFHRAEVLSAGITTWLNDKPHVIINQDRRIQGTNDLVSIGVGVPQNATLVMEPGTRVYCHAGATVQVDGTLLINQNFTPAANDTIGPNNPNLVRFMGDRREALYRDVPGQWGGIFFTEGSRNNVIRYAEIRNANFGVSLLNPNNNSVRPNLLLENVTIKNISGSNPSYVGVGLPAGGIVSLAGRVTANNCLLTNCGEFALLGVGGGAWTLNFCTIANYTPSFGQRKTASLTFTNEAATTTAPGPFTFSFNITNSIVWGSVEDELNFINADQYAAPIIRNSLLRTKEYNAATGTAARPGFDNNGNLLNQNPRFRRTPDTYAGSFDYRLDTLSPASNRPRTGILLPVDLWNRPRSLTTPDVGAYERENP